jgi:hypothetical protein
MQPRTGNGGPCRAEIACASLRTGWSGMGRTPPGSSSGFGKRIGGVGQWHERCSTGGRRPFTSLGAHSASLTARCFLSASRTKHPSAERLGDFVGHPAVRTLELQQDAHVSRLPCVATCAPGPPGECSQTLRDTRPGLHTPGPVQTPTHSRKWSPC